MANPFTAEVRKARLSLGLDGLEGDWRRAAQACQAPAVEVTP